jgi:hypothetical protein
LEGAAFLFRGEVGRRFKGRRALLDRRGIRRKEPDPFAGLVVGDAKALRQIFRHRDDFLLPLGPRKEFPRAFGDGRVVEIEDRITLFSGTTVSLPRNRYMRVPPSKMPPRTRGTGSEHKRRGSFLLEAGPGDRFAQPSSFKMPSRIEKVLPPESPANRPGSQQVRKSGSRRCC